ncbi:hypothetical protein J8273_5905 [Carpediemonas membranifera]|uniref:Uncharacterized protein n=1 Tax=Carpediemonas membranifera TaxID=201153 RepID=A0A8J6B2C6_9EUKA|nr:hypothetical protein J8273_5905 [Carpediemonas membranifera]|eukprot:KAG9392764.1 hypothetical protein J8273_5905 [Carpediemonas membranifera]
MESDNKVKIMIYAKGSTMEERAFCKSGCLDAEVKDFFKERLVDETDIASKAKDWGAEGDFWANMDKALVEHKDWINKWTSNWQCRGRPKACCPFHQHSATRYLCGFADALLFVVRTLALMTGNPQDSILALANRLIPDSDNGEGVWDPSLDLAPLDNRTSMKELREEVFVSGEEATSARDDNG